MGLKLFFVKFQFACILLVLVGVASSCSSTSKSLAIQNVSTNPINIEYILDFFNTNNDQKSDGQLFLRVGLNPTEDITFDINELELNTAIGFKTENYDYLVLPNNAENTFNLFKKDLRNNYIAVYSSEYFPESLKLYQINDTLWILHAYYDYQMKPALANVNEYYFIGMDSGLQKAFVAIGDALDFDLSTENGRIFSEKSIHFQNKSGKLKIVVSKNDIEILQQPKHGAFAIFYLKFLKSTTVRYL